MTDVSNNRENRSTTREHPSPTPGDDASEAVDELRRAEARLGRRRQATGELSETHRSAMRFILERTSDGITTSPSALAEYLDVTSASATMLVQRLTEAGLIRTMPDPDDRRRKMIVPVDTDLDADEIDPVTGQIRHLSEDLSPQEAKLVSLYLDRVTAVVDGESSNG
ncbi:DNA-binding MarR family transcriptional regulator [Pseudoclavibacter sp. JAI123]|uniref:MarR family winged helix-turn-helix transcriptional regulator n=1 Tax=Pseudoclavibacter sp. JAI123 TaxID=2723065 RepID=UPI0015CC65FE|nr:MarR family transcriptional regulator [Pseudoclavibacter sp. JAI123]NYF14784.1 DNA-binding MarR family transcriptional regulator [Pseudoclavibacter sp. JAI123]